MSSKQRIPFLFTEFEITDCRVGRRNESREQNEILRSAMSGFTDWVTKSGSISETFIEDAGDLYVKDAAMSGDLCCIVLWKQVGAGTTSYALDLNSPPGEKADVKSSDFGAGYLPGDPLYYLVDVAKTRLFTLRPPLAVRTCRPDLEQAIRFFLFAHSDESKRKVSRDEAMDSVAIRDEDDFNPSWVSFSSRLRRERALVDDLVGNFNKVRSLVHVIPLKNRSLEEKKRESKPFLAVFGRKFAQQDIEHVNAVRYEIDMEFEADDVRGVFNRQAEAAKGERFGFRLRGSDDIQWADTSISRTSHDLPLTASSGVYGAKELLEAAGKVI